MDELFNKIETFVSKSDIIQMSTVEGIIQNMMNNTGEYITNFSMKAVKIISDSILGVPTFIIKLIITIVSSFFFMVDYDKVINFVNSYIPEDRKEFVQKLKYYGVSTLGAYAKSYILLFLLTFIELTIGFNLIGIPYATIIALTVAIFDILPVLGTGGILIPWSIIGFAISNFKIGIGMMVLYLIITAIRNTLEPKIIGTQIGLHPLATLISMYLGLHIFGIVGMFIFPITLAVFTSINKNKEQTKEKLLN